MPELIFLKYWVVKNLYFWAMSEKVPVDNFQWIKDTFQRIKDFIKSYDEESDEEYFLEFDVHYSKNHMKLILIYHLYQKELKLKKLKSLLLIYMIKVNMLFI